ncbi:histidine kinase dimerization/phospho-acceptor domain-containing protein [uncultured Algimonas sp.]|uniref:histidine kinase dimerization/phospho-acceptor domain-containing protein n=1 Tax=uncultured Algimonas sp. TaxID=1547920 RepID=UPI002635D26A|nr:histidine kinase dimerization/phospho-acceptor domain-containing protein [uncultured Algimonas sp.]
MAGADATEDERRDALRESDVVIMSVFAIVAIAGLGALARVPVLAGLAALAGFWLAVLLFIKLSRAIRSSRPDRQDAQNEFLSGAQFAVTLTDALPQAIAVLDRDGRVIHANPLARELVDIETLGRPLSVYVRDAGITDRLARALAGYTPEPLMVHREVPTESYISLLFSAVTPVEDGSGRTIVLVVMNDVTELVLGNQRRADFLANASHELKTPMASMLGYIETLRGHAKDDPDAQERFLAIMAQQAERMQRLIQDLLSLRRIEQEEHIPPSETADLDLSVRAAIESVAPLAERRGVKLKYKKKKRAIVPGHQDETIQLCLNLIENATKLSPKGSIVHIVLSRFEQWQPGIPFADGRLPDTALTRTINTAPTRPLPLYTITISDEGPGFSRAHLPRIGERFYRVAGDLSSKEKGTGLGLAIVKHIARRHRAGLYVRTQDGAGTEFCIIYQESEEAPSETATPEPQSIATSETR